MGRNWRSVGADVKDVVGSSTSSVKDDLRLSLERRWKADNKLKALKAERQLAVLEANDIADEVKRYRTRVCATTERAMVSIEKAHSELRASGNVSEADESRVRTIVDTPSMSTGISPNSSASQAEFRAVQKQNIDLLSKIERYEKMVAAMDTSLEAFENKDKSFWTLNEENEKILDQLCPDGYGYDFETAPEGKFRPIFVRSGFD